MRRILTPFVTALAIAVLSGCSTDGRAPTLTAGPLTAGGAYRSYRSLDDVGATFSEGLQLLETSAPITVESVEVTGGDKALVYLGARIGLPGRPDDFNQFMVGFPPAAVPMKYQGPAAGARLEPGDTYMLIIGYRVIHDVLDLRTTITVHFTTSDGIRYSREFKAQVATCPSSLPEDECSELVDTTFGPLR